MSEMVERVARAIAGTGLIGYEPGCHEYRDIARVAIEAHEAALAEAGYVIVPREPTGKMWAAGRSRFWILAERHRQQTKTEAAHVHADTAPDDIWRAMIDAKLTPSPKVTTIPHRGLVNDGEGRQ